MNPEHLARLRAAVDDAHGRMVIVPRAALDALLQEATGARGDVVVLRRRDASRLARAAWDTATDPSYIDRYGRWGVNTVAHVEHHIAAAERVIDYLIAHPDGSPT